MSEDLITSITSLMNGVKETFHIPKFMTIQNITSIYKNNGKSRLDLENDRGIFLMTVFKKILDKLTYNDLYESLDSHMSDSNIGARKDNNIRNHLFIIYGIINNVNKSKDKCVEIQVFDLVKAFDSLSMENSMSDLVTMLKII